MTTTIKTLTLSIICALTVMPFQSCKKGPDDPFISFRSRKARLEGEWTLQTYKKNGTEQKLSGTTTYTFKKDGTANYKSTVGSISTSVDQRWDFLSRGNDYKKKERLFIYDKENTDGNVYDIVELRNDKLVLSYKVVSSGKTDEYVIEYTQ